MTDRGKAIYLNAKRYSNAGYVLNTAQSQDIDLLLPSIVNAALALELYFKALYYIENSADFKISGKHSHNFACLFDELRASTQTKIAETFDNLIKNRDMNDVEAIEKASSVVIPRDIEKNLKAWSEVFVKIRYIYDSNRRSLPMMFFPEIEQSVLMAISQHKPEWSSKP